MPSGEKIGSGAIKQEVVGETERATFEDRGEKTLTAAERAKLIKDLLEEKARLAARNEEIAKQLKALEQQERDSHIADPDQYWENVKQYNHDELQKVNAKNDDQAVLEKARAYNEAHANEMYENWQDTQDLPQNQTEEQWAAFYQNRGEEFGTSNEQPAVEQTPEQAPAGATIQATEQAPAETPGQAPVQAAANTAETEPDNNPTPEEADATEAAETISDNKEMPEIVKRLQEKSKNSKGFKKFFVGAATAVMIALAAAGIIRVSNPAEANAPANIPDQIEQTIDNGAEDLEDLEEDNTLTDYEAEKGIIDGYNKKGMFLSPNKEGEYDFAAASEVAELFDNDECEMMKYAARNQVEELANYMVSLPDQFKLQPFKGLTMQQTQDRLESLSNEDYAEAFNHFSKVIDMAFTRSKVINGDYINAYMRLKDPSKPATHENMELVQCTTHEENLKVREFYWLDEDGNEIGSMMVKIIVNEDGSFRGCMQVIDTDGSVYKDLPEIDPDPDTGSEGTGGEGTGGEGTGNEGTGGEGTGSEGTGNEGTGNEGTGSEGTDIQSKDPENLIRIDNKINDEIAQDIGTEEIDNYVNPGVREDDKTPAPSFEQDTMVTNPDSGPAPEVAPTVSDNNYSNNNGGANSGYRPNEQAQQNADSGNYTMPNNIEQADDALADLGIN